MKDLAALFEKLGCEDVRTYIQSGNVVFKASAAEARSIRADAAAGIRKRFGFDVPVALRSGAELRAIGENNPFGGVDEAQLAVVFLTDEPSAAAVKTLEPDRSPPDRFVVRGADIYLHLVNGFAGTKLTNQYFDSRLKTVSTARNWRTLRKLIEMSSE